MLIFLLCLINVDALTTLGTPLEEAVTTEIPHIEASVLHDLGEITVLPTEMIEKLQEKCKDGSCLLQDEKAVATKQFLRNELIDQQKKYNGTVDIVAIDRRFQKTFQLKQAILNKQGIADDGLFDGDMFLNEQQADEMLQKMNGPSPSMNKAGVALFLDNPDQEKYKWDVKKTIKYTVESLNEAFLYQIVDNVISHLMDKVPCLRFEKANTVSPNIPYLKIKGGGNPVCGISPFGRESEMGPTTIYIWPGSSNPECNTFRSNVLHFILHALGVLHMQQRYDRDQYINVFDDRLKNGAVEAFRIANDEKKYSTMEPFTTKGIQLFKEVVIEKGEVNKIQYFATRYGTKYDLQSVMHSRRIEPKWDRNAGALFELEPQNLTGVNVDDIGKFGVLSSHDILLLKEMYCLNPKCANEIDLKVCQTMFKRGQCTVKVVKEWCRRTCNLC